MKFFHFVLFAGLFTSYALAQERYFPQKGEWQSRSPESQGLNANGIEQAVQFAQKNEYSGAIDLKIAIQERYPDHCSCRDTGNVGNYRGKPQ